MQCKCNVRDVSYNFAWSGSFYWLERKITAKVLGGLEAHISIAYKKESVYSRARESLGVFTICAMQATCPHASFQEIYDWINAHSTSDLCGKSRNLLFNLKMDPKPKTQQLNNERVPRYCRMHFGYCPFPNLFFDIH